MQTQKVSSKTIDYPYVAPTVILFFCGYVITWYLQIGYRIPSLGNIRFEFLCAALLIVIAIFSKGFRDISNPLQKYLILFFICIIIEIPFSYDINTSWNIFIDRVVKFAFMAVFIMAFVKSPKDLKYFIVAFMLACLKMGQEGFIGKITGGLIWENQGIMRLHGSTPMYTDPNSFTGMAMGTLPFIYYLFPIVPRWIKAMLIIMLAFAINIILFSGSRTGYVAFSIFVLFVFLKSKMKMKFLMYALIIGIISFPMVPHDYVERFQSIFTGTEKEGHSKETRIEILRDAYKIFITHPLGVGVSAFPAVREATFGREQDTHNLYLEVATNLGIQGFIVFIFFLYNMMKILNGITRSAYKQLRIIEDTIGHFDNPQGIEDDIMEHISDLKLIYAVGSAVIMFLVIRLALGFFGMDLYEIYWWFALGLTVSLWNMNKYAMAKTECLEHLGNSC
jgi:hypothetical protein